MGDWDIPMWLLAIIVKPLFGLLYCLAVAIPVYLVRRFFPDGKLKYILAYDASDWVRSLFTRKRK